MRQKWAEFAIGLFVIMALGLTLLDVFLTITDVYWRPRQLQLGA